MKRQALSLISLLSLLLVAGSAIAQTVHVRANVPFNFTVGNKTLTAGTYDVENVSDRDGNMLVLRAHDGDSSLIVGSNAAESLKPADKTKLLFHKYGSQYFLAEIWKEGARRGNQVPACSREKELAQEIASDRSHRQVEIAASLY